MTLFIRTDEYLLCFQFVGYVWCNWRGWWRSEALSQTYFPLKRKEQSVQGSVLWECWRDHQNQHYVCYTLLPIPQEQKQREKASSFRRELLMLHKNFPFQFRFNSTHFYMNVNAFLICELCICVRCTWINSNKINSSHSDVQSSFILVW